MKGPMLRFAIVAFLLLILVIFYATRLGDELENESDDAPVPPADTGHSDDAETDNTVLDAFLDRIQGDAAAEEPATNAEYRSFGCDGDEIRRDAGRVVEALTDRENPKLIQLLDTLTASADAEHQLTVVELQMFLVAGANDPVEIADRQFATLVALETAVRLDPSNPLILWYASWGCNRGAAADFCENPVVQENIRNVMHNNGAYWAREAFTKHEAGERAAALEDLQRVATAPEYDNYYAENIRVLERALALMEDLSYIERAWGAFAFTNTVQTYNNAVYLMCELPLADDAWFDACLALAERGAAQGGSLTQQTMANTLLADLYEAVGWDDESRRAREQLEGMLDPRVRRSGDLSAVLLTDERVMSLYLEEFESGGEVDAMRFLAAEVERLKQDPHYTPCPADEAVE